MIATEIDIYSKILFTVEQIYTSYCDVPDAYGVVEMWVILGKSGSDVIADDDFLHTFEAKKTVVAIIGQFRNIVFCFNGGVGDIALMW